MAEPKSAKQRDADALVALSAGPDGGIYDLEIPDHADILNWRTCDESVFLDGYYQPEILIALGNHLLGYGRAGRSET